MRMIGAIITSLAVATVALGQYGHGYGHGHRNGHDYPLFAIGVGYNDNAEVLSELRKLRAEIRASRSPAAAAEKPPHPGLLLMRKDCASCHGADAKSKAGGREYFKGGELVADAKTREKMQDLIEAGDMPPNKEWSDADKYKASSYLRKASVAKK